MLIPIVVDHATLYATQDQMRWLMLNRNLIYWDVGRNVFAAYLGISVAAIKAYLAALGEEISETAFPNL